MSEIAAHGVAQVEPPSVGIHSLWSGPWQWVWSLEGWSIQRREVKESQLKRVCVSLDRTELQEVRLRRALRDAAEVLGDLGYDIVWVYQRPDIDRDEEVDSPPPEGSVITHGRGSAVPTS